ARGDMLSRFGTTTNSTIPSSATTARSSMSVKPALRIAVNLVVALPGGRGNLRDVLRRQVLLLGAGLAAGRPVRAVRREQERRAPLGRRVDVFVAPRVLGRRRRVVEVGALPVLGAAGGLPE